MTGSRSWTLNNTIISVLRQLLILRAYTAETHVYLNTTEIVATLFRPTQ